MIRNEQRHGPSEEVGGMMVERESRKIQGKRERRNSERERTRGRQEGGSRWEVEHGKWNQGGNKKGKGNDKEKGKKQWKSKEAIANKE